LKTAVAVATAVFYGHFALFGKAKFEEITKKFRLGVRPLV
jgi:hypothetical protein